MSKVYFEIIHEGTGEQRFGGKCLIVERHGKDVTELHQEIQACLDAWVKDEKNRDMLDEHGNAKPDLTVDEFLAILPSDLHAEMIDTPIRSAFV